MLSIRKFKKKKERRSNIIIQVFNTRNNFRRHLFTVCNVHIYLLLFVMFCEIPDEQFLVISWYLFCSTYLFYAILYIVIYFRWINDIGSIIVLYIFPHFYKLELVALKTYSIHQPRKIVITNNIIIQANNNSGINSINIRACRFQLEIPFTDTIRLIVLPLSRHVLNYIIMLCGKTVFVQFFVEGSQ